MNLFALKGIAFHKLAREGNLPEACEKLEDLIRAIESQEEKNIALILHVA